MCPAHLSFAEVTAARKDGAYVPAQASVKGLGNVRARSVKKFAEAVAARVAALDPALQEVRLHIPGQPDRIMPLTAVS